MTMKAIIKTIGLGLLSWLLPFAVSFLFYKPGGELVVPYGTFKSVIMVVGVISGCYLLFLHFRSVGSDFIKSGVIVGWTWFTINMIMDSIILIPMMKTTFPEYFMTIGISYVALPAISVTIGYLLSIRLEP